MADQRLTQPMDLPNTQTPTPVEPDMRATSRVTWSARQRQAGGRHYEAGVLVPSTQLVHDAEIVHVS